MEIPEIRNKENYEEVLKCRLSGVVFPLLFVSLINFGNFIHVDARYESSFIFDITKLKFPLRTLLLTFLHFLLLYALPRVKVYWRMCKSGLNLDTKTSL